MPAGLLRGLGRVNDAIMRVVPVDFGLTGEGMDYLTPGCPATTPSPWRSSATPAPTAETLADTARWLCDGATSPPSTSPPSPPDR